MIILLKIYQQGLMFNQFFFFTRVYQLILSVHVLHVHSIFLSWNLIQIVHHWWFASRTFTMGTWVLTSTLFIALLNIGMSASGKHTPISVLQLVVVRIPAKKSAGMYHDLNHLVFRFLLNLYSFCFWKLNGLVLCIA